MLKNTAPFTTFKRRSSSPFMSPRCLPRLAGALILFVAAAVATSQAKPPAEPAKPAIEKPAAAPAKPTDVVMWIGDEAFTAERFEALLRAVPPQFAQAANQMGKKQFATQYHMLYALSKHAQKLGIDQSPEFKQQVGFMTLQLLAQIQFQELSKNTQAVPDAQVAGYYKEHAKEYLQAKVRGIFVALNPPAKGDSKEKPKPRTDAEAKSIAVELRQKILAGADFATVAKESSDETQTAAKGGDFGLIRAGQLPAGIEKAVFALKEKEVSEPIQEATGYYLFLLEELRTTTLEEATPQIRSQLAQKSLVDALEKVKAEYALKFNDAYFDAPPAPPAPPPVKQ
jgi:hypothetical protein